MEGRAKPDASLIVTSVNFQFSPFLAIYDDTGSTLLRAVLGAQIGNPVVNYLLCNEVGCPDQEVIHLDTSADAINQGLVEAWNTLILPALITPDFPLPITDPAMRSMLGVSLWVFTLNTSLSSVNRHGHRVYLVYDFQIAKTIGPSN